MMYYWNDSGKIYNLLVKEKEQKDFGSPVVRLQAPNAGAQGSNPGQELR